MKTAKIFLAFLIMMLASIPAWAEVRSSDKEQMRNEGAAMQYELKSKLEEAQAPPQHEPPNTFLIAIPEFHYTRTKAFDTKLQGNKLSHESGDSHGSAILLIGRRQINEVWGVGALYHYVNIDYDGGILVPRDGFAGPGSSARGESKQTAETHMLGILTDFNFKQYGRLMFVAAHSWDFYDGHEKMQYNIPAAGGYLPTEKRSLDQQESTILSLKLWYEVDAPITDNFTITPYIGYRYMYATASDMNDWNGVDGDYSDLWVWHHMGSLGAKFKYRHGLTSLNGRLGYSRRFKSDPIVGYAGRFTDQTVCHLGYNTNYDRDSVAFGVGIDHVIPEVGLILGLKYDGMAGSKIDSHSFGATIGLMF